MASVLDKTQKLADERGWTQWVMFMLMIDYLHAGDLLEEFLEFALEAASLENKLGY